MRSHDRVHRAAAAGGIALRRAPVGSVCRQALGLAVATAVALLLPGQAIASHTQESIFQDDDLLVYNTPAGTDKALDTLAALGVQRVRVSLFWRLVAPSPLSRTKPNFDAADSTDYPAGAWDRYDRLITDATARGIAVNLDITSPAPLWATGRPDRADIADTYQPSAAEFGAFVRAAAGRYSGSLVLPGATPPTPTTPTPSPTPSPPPPNGNPLSNLLGQLLGTNPNGSGSSPAPTPSPAPPPVAPGQPLPRVSSWSLWNEPNQAGWLTPQWTPSGAEASPAIYRRLLDAGYAALAGTGHAGDTILIGETAPKGLNVKGETRAIKPLPFIRALYCVDQRLRPLRGAAAAARGCPTSAAGVAAFARQHPALFNATGWAHHPYELTFAPTAVPKDPSYVTIATLGRLSATLRTIRNAYHRGGGLPLYMTEFGYLTKPPNPLGVSLAQQAAYLNQAEFMAYQQPQVRSWDQFLLVDAPALPGQGHHSALVEAFGGTFQTGLAFHAGAHKPSYDAYRLPIFLPNPVIRRGGLLRVWGMVRPAPATSGARVAIQLRRNARAAYATLTTATTRPRPGYFDVRIRVPGSGQLRLAWRDPASNKTYFSRTVVMLVR
jgi:hypothetical protein